MAGIGYVDLEFSDEDRKQLGMMAIDFFEQIPALFKQKKTDEIIDLLTNILFNAFILGVVKGSTNSSSVRMDLPEE